MILVPLSFFFFIIVAIIFLCFTCRVERSQQTIFSSFQTSRDVCPNCGFVYMSSWLTVHPDSRLDHNVQRCWVGLMDFESRFCQTCLVPCTDVTHNANHQLSVHGFLTTYLCAQCDASYASKIAMLFHVLVFHAPPLPVVPNCM